MVRAVPRMRRKVLMSSAMTRWLLVALQATVAARCRQGCAMGRVCNN
jgi:hypothetical protein